MPAGGVALRGRGAGTKSTTANLAAVGVGEHARTARLPARTAHERGPRLARAASVLALHETSAWREEHCAYRARQLFTAAAL